MWLADVITGVPRTKTLFLFVYLYSFVTRQLLPTIPHSHVNVRLVATHNFALVLHATNRSGHIRLGSAAGVAPSRLACGNAVKVGKPAPWVCDVRCLPSCFFPIPYFLVRKICALLLSVPVRLT